MASGNVLTTDRQLAALRPAEKLYEVSIGGARGLAVRVFPTGTKAFEFRYVTAAGKRRRLPLGTYPGLKLADAREKAATLRVSVVHGGDPAEARAAARIAARTGETLDELFEAYQSAGAKGLHGGRGRPKTPKAMTVEESCWRLHIRPKLGERKFADVGRADVKSFMRELAAKGDLSAAYVASIGGVLRAVFAFAVYEERLEINPAVGLTRPLAPKTRDRMFDDEALGTIWAALIAASSARVRGEERPDMGARLEPTTALALRFTLLTLCRRAETAGARWKEIDEKNAVWTIPAGRAKARRMHLVPLSAPALEVLKQARTLGDSEFVFPAAEDAKRPLPPGSMTLALTRICERHDVAHGSPHDFRRSGATTLTSERYGVRRFFISKVLGHSANDGGADVTGVYDRNDYLAEKRTTLATWGRHIVELNDAVGS
jgi:integrase